MGAMAAPHKKQSSASVSGGGGMLPCMCPGAGFLVWLTLSTALPAVLFDMPCVGSVCKVVARP